MINSKLSYNIPVMTSYCNSWHRMGLRDTYLHFHYIEYHQNKSATLRMIVNYPSIVFDSFCCDYIEMTAVLSLISHTEKDIHHPTVTHATKFHRCFSDQAFSNRLIDKVNIRRQINLIHPRESQFGYKVVLEMPSLLNAVIIRTG